MSNIIGKFQQMIVPAIKGYGRQIGKTSPSGLNCYAKKVKGGKQYTTIDSKTGQLVRKKLIYGDNKSYLNINTFDNKSNLLHQATICYQPITIGVGANNQFAKQTRVIHEDYNKFGQLINSHDATFTPRPSSTKVDVLINYNGKISKTYIDTLKKTKHTITCVE